MYSTYYVLFISHNDLFILYVSIYTFKFSIRVAENNSLWREDIFQETQNLSFGE